MTYAGTVDVSSSAWSAYVAEVTPGTTPVTPTWSMIPAIQQGTTWPQLAPDRRPVRILNSSANNIIGYIDAQGRTNAAILQPIIPTFIGNWLSAIGLNTTGTSGVGHGTGFLNVQPTISLLDVDGAIDAKIWAGMRAARLTFSGSSSQGTVTLLTELLGIKAQASTSAPAVPSETFEDPYTWSDWQVPVLPGAVAAMECDDWEVVIDLGIGGGNGEFWGGGQVMPTRTYKTQHDVTGKLTILHATAEEGVFKIANGTAGQFEFTFNYPTGGHNLILNLPKGKYVTYVADKSQGKFITGMTTFGGESIDLSDVIAISVA